MLIRVAYLYVGCLFALGVVLLFISLLIEANIVTVSGTALFSSGNLPFFIAFAIGASAIALAKERNIWRNEFRNYPKWMRVASVLISTSGFLACTLTVLANEDSPRSQLLLGAGFAVFSEPIALCVLYSLLWASPVTDSELLKRTVVSLIALMVCVLFIVSSMTGIFHRF